MMIAEQLRTSLEHLPTLARSAFGMALIIKGFQDGWGKAIDQLVAMVRKMQKT